MVAQPEEATSSSASADPAMMTKEEYVAARFDVLCLLFTGRSRSAMTSSPLAKVPT
jgi:hypothetical protein